MNFVRGASSLLLLSFLMGCPDPDAPPSDSANRGLVSETASKVDVLFVLDNSASMASKQLRLSRQIARMVDALTSGDRYAGMDEAAIAIADPSKARRFAPVQSVHLGLVTTNMGGLDALDPNFAPQLMRSCLGHGDDGKLQSSTVVATTGVVAERAEFPGVEAGDVVITPDPACVLPPQPSFQQLSSDSDFSAVVHAFQCTARVGVRGCAFEQPLEAMWKALAPSAKVPANDPLYTFNGNTMGHGDLGSAGFLREDAMLVVVHLTDEDDCSITDAGKALFNLEPWDETYGQFNLRCGLQANDPNLIRSTQRYVDALRSLKPGHPERVVFAAVTGVPQAAIAAGATYDQLLAAPEMQFREQLDPTTTAPVGVPVPSCTSSDGKEVAYPAIRFVQLAKALGDQAVLESICADDYGPAIDKVVLKVAAQLGAL